MKLKPIYAALSIAALMLSLTTLASPANAMLAGQQPSRAATNAELSRLHTWYVANSGSGGAVSGFSAAQIATYLSAARTIPNPVAQANVPITTPIPKGAVQAVADQVQLDITAQSATNAALAPYVVLLNALVTNINAYVGTGQAGATVTFTPSVVAGYATQIQTLLGQYLSTADTVAIQSLLTEPDPNWQPTIPGGPLAFEVLGEDALPEAADITAAEAYTGSS